MPRPNKEANNAYMKQYGVRPEVKAARKKYMAKWRKNHRDDVLAYSKTYHTQHRDEQNAARRRRIMDNPGKYREYHWRDQKITSRDGLPLTYAMYLSILESQGYVCPICRRMLTAKNGHPDHNHKTGFIRAVLCKKCNSSLGLLGDDLKVLDAAAAYLRMWDKE